MSGGLRADYERAVRALRDMAADLRAANHGPEAVARAVHAERRRLAAAFKARTPEPFRSRIRDRTRAVYGDELGPTVEMLRATGKSWEEITESACRPGSAAFVRNPAAP
ncbi:MAG: cell wall-binding protein [Rhodobacteraceae bacterium]|nr:cell wall-binding protein [Paracoccaceae bacterium]